MIVDELNVVCVACGTAFRAKNALVAKYCSKVCRSRFIAGIGSHLVRTCCECGSEFRIAVGRGTTRRQYCSPFCARKGRKRVALSKAECAVDGCGNPRGYSSPPVCNSCWYRLQRTGTLDRLRKCKDCGGTFTYARGKKGLWYCNDCRAKRLGNGHSVTRYEEDVIPFSYQHTNGYVMLAGVAHDLATGGRVYEHRAVLYDAIGPGPHPCHWCKDPVDWVKGKCVRGSLVPDHLDGNKANNALNNLVPACNRCNSSRGLFMAWVLEHRDDPVLWRLYEEAIRPKAVAG